MGIKDVSSIIIVAGMSSSLLVADSGDGVEDLSGILIVVGMSGSLIVAGSVDGVEDLSSIPDEDDTCPVVLLW